MAQKRAIHISNATRRAPRAHQANNKQHSPLTVVGIGASAGGLDPARRFFTEMPTASGMAFVLIQHLDPVHKSEIASLLGHCTKMTVVEASDGARLEANHVYVIPPNRALTIHSGRIRLSKPAEPHGRRMSIDFFFRSLAGECQERAIGIIFSGTGSDGTSGLQAIKVAGGLTIAQDPQTAEHEGMPRSAISAGVDFVLSVQEMPQVLLKYAKHPYVRSSSQSTTAHEKGQDQFPAILSLLKTRAKFDFGSYKRGTLQRRVQRRMSLRHMTQTRDYLDLLRHNGDEVSSLLKDLLISVTHFFREPDAWKVLQQQAIRPLIAGKNDDSTIRIWVPGCATGEEAYSIGMILLDELSTAGKNCRLNIFASDVNAQACIVARAGLYPESAVSEISPQRLRRYFVREGEQYRVRKELRDAVVFADHNLLTDPPFSRLDLISCRNLMIYLDPAAQKKVISLFHYALREGGFLLLGSAETVGERHDLFRTVSRKARLYGRIGSGRSESIDIPLDGGHTQSQIRPTNIPSPTTAPRFNEMAQQIILDRLAPTCVVINQKHEILYTCGPIENYLKQPAGVMQTDVLRWASDSLRSKLRAALKKVQTAAHAITLPDVHIRRGNSTSISDITIEPLTAPRQADGLILITFRDSKFTAHSPSAAPVPTVADDETVVHQLEDELKTTREDLQNNIDQLAASNEELKASNEEVTSINEELQSTNEELETSKEELQSLNEELSTVNNQLQAKVDELETKTNDLNNLLSSTDIATIFLDRQFQIKWFTSQTTHLLRLRTSDIGRPIGDFAQKFTGGDLLGDAEHVLNKLTPVERQVQAQEGHWYLRRVLPYRTADNRIDGVVVTFVDIHNLRLAEEKLRRLATVLQDSNDAITMHDFAGRIMAWNHGAELMFGYTETEALRRNAVNLVPRSKRTEMRGLLEDLQRGGKNTSLETQRQIKGGRIIDVWLTITALADEQGRPVAIATTERDITQRKQDETALRELNESLEKRVADRSALAEQQAQRLRELAAQLLVTEEQERRNLAADLHDNLTQVLHVAKMKLSELRAASDGDGDHELFHEVEDLLARANQSARSLSYQLSPPILYELGLIPALEWLGEEMKRLYRLDVLVEKDDSTQSLDEQTRVILFRAVRELLVNVAKHAGVHRAKIRIRRVGRHIILKVEDHGVGFDPKVLHDPKNNRGLGLFSIRERLDYLGGSMEINSVAGKKTTITLSMPVIWEKKRAAEVQP